MFKVLLLLFGVLLGLADLSHAQGFACTPDTAWRQVRAAYSIHIQIIASCQDRASSDHVIVLTEPPHHIVRSKAEPIVRALFASRVKSVAIRRLPLGYNGWVDDLVIVVQARSAQELATLADDLALLAQLSLGSTYKAEVEDIGQLTAPPLWQAPPALDVRAEETHAWLLGSAAQLLVPAEGGTAVNLATRAGRNETGVFHTSVPGLVVALLPNGTSSLLNNFAADLRRFVLDTDVFLGAIRMDNRVALIGRERSTSLAATPPLRVETILLLASSRTAQLSQSYERNRPFAGKLLVNAGDLFSWDWAPILLSDELNDTEFGSLLNFTDNMLKGWSEGGKIQYKGFPHPNPASFPFGPTGALRTLASGTGGLTYNWNTAGVGYQTRIGNVDVFAVRNSGSLPVSYFPEGGENDPANKARLVKAEDDAYRYFSSLRNPMLQRAVQYAALYQVFLAFEMRARPPHDPAARAAAFSNVETVLQQQLQAALNDMARPLASLNRHKTLFRAYMQFGDEARRWQSAVPREYADSVAKIEAEDRQRYMRLAETLRSLDVSSPNWRSEIARAMATGYPAPPPLQARIADIRQEALPSVRSLEDIRKAVVATTEHTPESWIRTPSIVVSRGEARNQVGGHNIGGQATRVVVDSSVPKGSVEASGSYVNGRVLRLHPDDAARSRDLVRLFDREVGLRDQNIAMGKRILEAKLREGPVIGLQPRAMMAALEPAGPAQRLSRGAAPNPRASSIGERPIRTGELNARAIAEAAERGNYDIMIGRTSEGRLVMHRRAPPPPVNLAMPNMPSLLSTLPRELRLASAGPPPLAHAKLGFSGIGKGDIDRLVATLEVRAKAVSGGGAKPPYGGDRGPLAFADMPEPGRGFGQGRMPLKPDDGMFNKALDGAREMIGRDSSRVHVVDGDRTVLKTQAKWSEAEVRLLDPDATILVRSPEQAGFVQIIEVRVPIEVASGPKSLIMWIKAWFKERLTNDVANQASANVKKLIKEGASIDAEAAAARVKALIKDTYKADDAWFHIYLEGANSVTVVEAPQARSERPRG